MLVEFPVKIPLTDTEDSGSVSPVAIAGLEREPDMFPLRLFQSRQRSTVRRKPWYYGDARIAKDSGKVLWENAGSFA